MIPINTHDFQKTLSERCDRSLHEKRDISLHIFIMAAFSSMILPNCILLIYTLGNKIPHMFSIRFMTGFLNGLSKTLMEFSDNESKIDIYLQIEV